MAQAELVPILIRVRITGASPTTSTKSIRSPYDALAAGHTARSIPLNLVVASFVTDAHQRAVQAVAWRGA